VTRDEAARREVVAELALTLPREFDKLAARLGPDVFSLRSAAGRALDAVLARAGKTHLVARFRAADSNDLRMGALGELARASETPEATSDELLDALEELATALAGAHAAPDLTPHGVTAQLAGIEAREAADAAAASEQKPESIHVDPTVDTKAMRRLEEAASSPAPKGGGLRIGKYELIRLLDTGGMGELWVARDTYTEREVALKLIKQDDDPDIETKIKRFRLESKAAAAATHPNIVTLFDAGTDEAGTHYIALELLVGYQQLQSSFSASDPLAPDLIARLMLQAVEALRTLHATGYVHRDIKPANLLVNLSDPANPRLKVLDFGLAKKMERTKTQAVEGAPLTGHWVVGTPDYMAREQWENAPLTAQTDFYALGCVQYQLLTGSPPFCCLPKHLRDPKDPEAHTRLLSNTQKMLAHLEWRPDSVLAYRPDAPAVLVALTEKLMAKDAGARPRDHDEIKKALVDYLEGDARRKAEEERDALKVAAARRATAVFAGLLLLLFLAGLYIVLKRPFAATPLAGQHPEPAEPKPSSEPPAEPQQPTTAPKPLPAAEDPVEAEAERQKNLLAKIADLLSKGQAIDALALALDERLDDPAGEQATSLLTAARKQTDDADVALDAATLRRFVKTVRDRGAALAQRKVYVDEKDLADLDRHAEAADAYHAAAAVDDPAQRLAALDDVIVKYRNTPAWPKAAKKAVEDWSAGLGGALDIGPSTSWTARMRPERTPSTEPSWGNDKGELLLKDALAADSAESWIFKDVPGARRGWSMKMRFTPSDGEGRVGIALSAVFTGDWKRSRLLDLTPSATAHPFEWLDWGPETKTLGRLKLAPKPEHTIVFAVLARSCVLVIDGDLLDAAAVDLDVAPADQLAFVVRRGEARFTDIRLHP